jgi:hypothetical protein
MGNTANTISAARLTQEVPWLCVTPSRELCLFDCFLCRIWTLPEYMSTKITKNVRRLKFSHQLATDRTLIVHARAWSNADRHGHGHG